MLLVNRDAPQTPCDERLNSELGTQNEIYCRQRLAQDTNDNHDHVRGH